MSCRSRGHGRGMISQVKVGTGAWVHTGTQAWANKLLPLPAVL